MAFSLSTSDLARLEGASRALLSPLAFDRPDDWRDAVMATACEALGARRATFCLPGAAGSYTRTFRMDRAFEATAAYYLEAAYTGAGPSPDPVINRFFGRLLAEELELWDSPSEYRKLGLDPSRTTDDWTADAIVPNRMLDGISLFVPGPAGVAHLTLHDQPAGAEPGERLPVLGLLLPSLKAGLDARARLAVHRAALDAAAEPLVAFDADGREVFRSAALARLLAADPEAARLEAALAALAARVRPLAYGRRADAPAVPVAAAEARTARAAYALRAVLLAPDALGDAFLVTVEPRGLAAALPAADAVRQRFGLTRREAEVALLVAEGLANDAIADRLFVSPHTVRHHVEAAMAKLGLTGRGREAVPAAPLAGGPGAI